MARDEWVRAGLTDDDDRFERPVSNAPWYVPPDTAIRVVGDMLIWHEFEGSRRDDRPEGYIFGPEVSVGRGILQAFLQLRDAGAEKIVTYARRWGVLGLCEQHLLPRSVVVEHNGDAVAPSEFPERQLNAGDRLEIVKIVAGG